MHISIDCKSHRSTEACSMLSKLAGAQHKPMEITPEFNEEAADMHGSVGRSIRVYGFLLVEVLARAAAAEKGTVADVVAWQEGSSRFRRSQLHKLEVGMCAGVHLADLGYESETSRRSH